MATQPVSTFTDYAVADLSLATFGRKAIEIAETEMPGLMALPRESGAAPRLRGARRAGDGKPFAASVLFAAAFLGGRPRRLAGGAAAPPAAGAPSAALAVSLSGALLAAA